MTKQDIWKEKTSLLLKRFAARTDTFGVVHKYSKEVYDNGQFIGLVEEKTIMPECVNYGNQSLCQITMKKGGCLGCPAKQYAPLTEEWAGKHISGEKELVFYLVTENGIKFGACDFDYNEPFVDALKVYNLSREMGIPCYIARSSKKGYHLYWFFSEFIPAAMFTSLTTYIYDKLGFFERFHANPDLTPPEVFPKQTTYEAGKIGNGIKVPMIEPRMKEGFNCWVDTEAKPLPIEEQWKFLAAAEEVSKEQLQAALDKYEVRLIDAPVNRRRSVGANGAPSEKPPYVKPDRGDFRLLVRRCPAMWASWEKDEAGAYKIPIPSHMSRVAGLSFAIRTKNGLDVLRERWPSDRAEKEIKYALESNQMPWTCKAMQDHGICHIGIHPKSPCKTKCMEKKVPMIKVDGRFVEDPQYKDEKGNIVWDRVSDPSPIRLANDGAEPLKYEQIMERLTPFTQEGAQPEDAHDIILGCLRSARTHLSSEDQRKVEDFISRNKLMGKREIKQAAKTIERQIKDEEVELKRTRQRTFRFNNVDYFIEDGRYTKSYVDSRGNPQNQELTNFVIEIKEEIEEIDSIDDNSSDMEKTIKRRFYSGEIVVDGQRKPFRQPVENWLISYTSFYQMLSTNAGCSIICRKDDFEDIKTCVTQFNKRVVKVKKKVSDIGHNIYKGEDYYLMPNTVVTKNEIRANTDFEIHFPDESTRQLGFAIISEDEFKDLGRHILNDYFNSNSRMGSMLAFAHAMAASMMSHMPLNKSPILWIAGDQSGGKSFVLEAAQCFFGNFKEMKSVDTSEKSKIQTAMDYRHCLLYIDDYKESLAKNHQEFYKILQQVYDRSGRTSLKRDGTQRDRSVKARGLVAFSGEDFPLQQESAITRMLIAEVGKYKDTEKGEKVVQNRSKYSGITAHFVRYIYNMDRRTIRDLYTHYVDLFEKPVKDKYDSSLRVAQNIAMNMTAFDLAMELFYLSGIMPEIGKRNLIQEHIKNLENVRTTVCGASSAQKGCRILLDGMNELLQDRSRYYLEGYPDHELETDKYKNAKPLGFWKEETPEIVYIHPQIAYGEVKMMPGKTQLFMQGHNHIGRQLVSEGHIPPHMFDQSSPTYTRQVQTIRGTSYARVWSIRLKSIGLIQPELGKTSTGTAATKSAEAGTGDFMKNIQ